jgi:hypothetical protein
MPNTLNALGMYVSTSPGGGEYGDATAFTADGGAIASDGSGNLTIHSLVSDGGAFTSNGSGGVSVASLTATGNVNVSGALNLAGSFNPSSISAAGSISGGSLSITGSISGGSLSTDSSALHSNGLGTLTATQFVGGGAGLTGIASPITGTTTNNNAGAGIVGQFITATVAVGSAVSLSSGTPLTVTSISLTAGDWDVTGVVDFHPGTLTTGSYFQGGISTTTNALGAQDQYSSSPMALAAGLGVDVGLNCPTVRLSLATTTTVYLTCQAGFATSTMVAYGTIRARRVR